MHVCAVTSNAAYSIVRVCRLAPSSQADQLRSDRDELAACAAPVGVSELRARGDARFRAGDAEGAAEVFGVLIALPRHMAPGEHADI